jgi:RNA polymerase sigma-70 factor, ECF subfamily
MERTQRFRDLLAPVHDDALAFARCLCRSHAEGDDVYQEAALRALGKLDDLREDRAFKAWLYRVIISVQRTRYRRGFWRRFLPLPERGAAELAASTAASAEQDLGGAERIRQALARLPSEQRETIVLFELEGWKLEEIAALHRVSLSAVKSRLVRGRARLRKIYLERFGVSASAGVEPVETLELLQPNERPNERGLSASEPSPALERLP